MLWDREKDTDKSCGQRYGDTKLGALWGCGKHVLKLSYRGPNTNAAGSLLLEHRVSSSRCIPLYTGKAMWSYECARPHLVVNQ
jgi:hypothetical protein